MEHEGKPLAADETDSHHHRDPRVASVHVRVVVTWLAIFPMAAIGMTILAAAAPSWPPVLKALVLTAAVVPTAVYVAVPRLLMLHSRIRSRWQAHPHFRAPRRGVTDEGVTPCRSPQQ